MSDPFEVLFQTVACLRIVNSPTTATISLATVQHINAMVSQLATAARQIRDSGSYVVSSLENISKFYEYLDFPNQIPDGSIPFPENEQDLSLGISLEFKNVSFRYNPNAGLALTSVSFKIEPGQLCVRLSALNLDLQADV